MNYVLTQKHLNPPFEISNFVQIGYKSMRKLICYKVPFNLLVPICYLCHDKKRIVGKRIVHKPVKRRGCVFCHDPHSSNHTSHLLQAEQTLCADLRCHPKFAKITINHPIKGHPVSGKQDPLQPERELSCRSCHNPHSADFPFLFPAEQYLFCAKCHRY